MFDIESPITNLLGLFIHSIILINDWACFIPENRKETNKYPVLQICYSGNTEC